MAGISNGTTLDVPGDLVRSGLRGPWASGGEGLAGT